MQYKCISNVDPHDFWRHFLRLDVDVDLISAMALAFIFSGILFVASLRFRFVVVSSQSRVCYRV